MLTRSEAPARPQILYSCYTNYSREGEQFVPEHVFSYQLAGTLLLDEGSQTHALVPGTFRFLRRNHLVKFQKQLPADGSEFRSLSVSFSQDMLRALAQEYGYPAAARQPPGTAVLALPDHPLYQSYLASLRPYEQLALPDHAALLALKAREAVLVLLQVNPELRDVLFDFSEPGKIDLEAFMQKNFRFNVAISRFAYLTGRSLATFKRDFERLFRTSPSRWLVQRRLQEAYYLLKEKSKTPSEVYLEVGFEDLSHFSFAFKKAYGVAPSKLLGAS
ncbi:AraC family transcriptional regulator [Hymenobacter setariae]|uniref:AraC family transcriptional regulator n=1 Tax=Hymenobacter setariae TaxID=2594794 RepID=A0A558BU90_9BACT|nr:AraC family transcriptional regulator [Hymenobacter setariae]TVT40090.1 AraC family transcriptional regulator [Hymenobacter setariae]